MQQGDVKLFQTNDDGDISVVNGVVEMSGGLETAAYLSLFGGNEDDDGSADSTMRWWGNLSETEASRKYVSETQHLLTAIPAVSANLLRIEDAARRDLNWFITDRIASSVTVRASVPALNRVAISVTIIAQGEESTFNFTENWRATV
jgi:phage gp46-like protein